MQLTSTTFLLSLATIVAMTNALAIPPTQTIPNLTARENLSVNQKRAPIPPTNTPTIIPGPDSVKVDLEERAPIPPTNTPTIIPGPDSIKEVPELDDDEDEIDYIGPVDDDDDETDHEPLTEAEEELLKSLQLFDDDDDESEILATRDLERRSLLSKLLQLLLKKASKTTIGKKVWNALGSGLRAKITNYFKNKARKAVTSADKSWLKKIIKGTVKSVLKGIIGSYATGVVLDHVLPWVVDVILSIIY